MNDNSNIDCMPQFEETFNFSELVLFVWWQGNPFRMRIHTQGTTLLLNYTQKNEDNNLNISRVKGVLFIKLRKKLGYIPTHYPYKWLTICKTLESLYSFTQSRPRSLKLILLSSLFFMNIIQLNTSSFQPHFEVNCKQRINSTSCFASLQAIR